MSDESTKGIVQVEKLLFVLSWIFWMLLGQAEVSCGNTKGTLCDLKKHCFCPNLGNDTQQFETVFNINRLHKLRGV
jgi:hypothetical protein